MRPGVVFFSFFLFIWGTLSAIEEFPQIRCVSVKIKEGCLEDVKAWFRHNQQNKEESLEAFADERRWMECAFIDQIQDDYYIIYFMKADDIVKAREVYRNSTLPADVFHKECWKKFTHIDHCKVFTPIYQMERAKLSCK